MDHDANRPLTRVIAAAETLSEILDSWRDQDGDYLPKMIPLTGDLDDLEGFAIDLESAWDDVTELADEIGRGKRDSADLSILLEWDEDISESLADLEASDTKAASELKDVIEKMFHEIRVAIDAAGDSVRGRRDFYVYVHKDKEGKIFYVGKGTGKRAWSMDRHPLWHKYVTEHLAGSYDVEIVETELLEHKANAAEAGLMSQYQGQLVNWIEEQPSGIGLEYDPTDGTVTIRTPRTNLDDSYYEALGKFHDMRNETRRAVEQEKQNEKIDPEGAIARYREAIAQLHEYAKICPREPGLKGELMGPWVPLGVDLEPLDRLTLLLAKQGKFSELIEAVDSLFQIFPDVKEVSVGQKIWKRREKALLHCPDSAG